MTARYILRELARALAYVGLASLSPHAGASQPYDLLIRGGTVLDGTGVAGVRADVGVRGDRIAFVGRAGNAKARQTIDASGLIVAPGFIDPHNHVDGTSLWLRERVKATGPILNEGYLTQGVTTIVGGPDGGYSPSGLRDVMAKFSQAGITTNYAFYVGHNGIRKEVMGSAHRAATAEELQKMTALVREGMQMGAVGLSTGLMYEPGMFSDTAEVVALTKAVKPFDGIYDSHVRDPAFQLMISDEEAVRIGREAGIPVKIAHEKAVGLINEGRIKDVIALIEKERANGHEVVTDQYPYDGAAVGSLTDLLVVPKTIAADSGTYAAPQLALERVQRILREPENLRKVRDASESGIDGGFTWIRAVGYGSMRIVDSQDFPELVGKNLELLAKERGVEPFALVVDLITRSRTPTFVTYGAIAEREVQQLLRQPWNMIGSDGNYVGRDGEVAMHPRSTGTFTRVLGHYTRELKVLELADAVRKMTSLTADFLRLHDRGRIQVGKAADITVFDAARVRDTSTWTKPQSLSQGIVHVVVNGELALRDGAPTGATPGKVIKRQSAVPR